MQFELHKLPGDEIVTIIPYDVYGVRIEYYERVGRDGRMVLSAFHNVDSDSWLTSYGSHCTLRIKSTLYYTTQIPYRPEILKCMASTDIRGSLRKEYCVRFSKR